MEYPDSSWNWTNLRNAARKLTRDRDGDGRVDQWGLQVSNDMETSWGNYVYQAGGQILDDSRYGRPLYEVWNTTSP